MRTVSAQLKIPEKNIVSRLSYSHLEQLVVIEDSLKRSFYEIESVQLLVKAGVEGAREKEKGR